MSDEISSGRDREPDRRRRPRYGPPLRSRRTHDEIGSPNDHAQENTEMREQIAHRGTGSAEASGFRAQELMDDLAAGQIVIVTARWILVLAGLLLALWNPGPIGEIRLQILVIFLLAFANFYLHAQVLRRRPAVTETVFGASAADLTVITLLVATQGGFESNLYVFYFPAILAFAVAFPTPITLLFAGGAMLLYAMIYLFSLGSAVAEGDLQIVLTRLLMLAAVAVCGNMYWRIERGRRQAATEAQAALMAQLRVDGSAT